MRKFALATMVAASMFLSGCATTGGGGGLSDAQIQALIVQIQAYTAKACAFEPQAASVVALVTQFYPAAGIVGSIVTTIGDAICRAPTTAAAAKRGTVITTKSVQTPSGQIIKVRGRVLR